MPFSFSPIAALEQLIGANPHVASVLRPIYGQVHLLESVPGKAMFYEKLDDAAHSIASRQQNLGNYGIGSSVPEVKKMLYASVKYPAATPAQPYQSTGRAPPRGPLGSADDTARNA